jgi:hypothetical protein
LGKVVFKLDFFRPGIIALGPYWNGMLGPVAVVMQHFNGFGEIN